MKYIVKSSLNLLIGFSCVAMIFTSCGYKDIKDAVYPDQTIYLPAANSGTYVINSVPEQTTATPTPGYIYRFSVDTVARKFTIPLSVYRAGINNSGEFNINILSNSDTINKMITLGKLSGFELMSATAYSIPPLVTMVNGNETASFNLVINLDYLLTNPSKKFALGVGISSTQRKSNPLLNTAIIVVETAMMVPTANFTTSAAPTNVKMITFSNSSLFAASYKWDFGDASAVSTDKSPIHTYAASGTYSVTLKATGVAGSINKSIKTVVITVP